jgi:hypothetical protein
MSKEDSEISSIDFETIKPDIFLSDRELKKLFSSNFDQMLKDHHVVHFYKDNNRTGTNDYLFCSRQDFANIIFAFHKYTEQKKQKKNTHSLIKINSGHGIIPTEIFENMQQQTWWSKINKGLKQLRPEELGNYDDPLFEIIKPYTMDTIPIFYRRPARKQQVRSF